MIQVELSAAEITVEAGGTAQLTVTVTNKQPDNDHVSLEIEGIDVEWYALPVPTLTIPADASQSSRILFKIRREPGVLAGTYPFLVRCRGLESGETGVQQASLIIKPFSSLQVELNPKRATATFFHPANVFDVAVSNYGNQEETLDLFATDPEDACAYDFETDRIKVKPGHTETVPLLVEPVTRLVVGASRLFGFSVTARSTVDSYVSANAHGQLERRALMSALSAAVLLVTFIIAVGAAIWWPRPVAIRSFTATPTTVVAGDNVQLAWDVANMGASSVIMPGNMPVKQGVDNVIVHPMETTTYTLLARGFGPEQKRTVTVIVTPRPPEPKPQIDAFTASQYRIHQGDAVTLSWKLSGSAKSVMLNPTGATNDAALFRSFEARPDTTTTYILTVKGDGPNDATNVVSKSLTITVVPPNVSIAEIDGFRAKPGEIEAGKKATLLWQVDNASSIEIDNGVGGSLRPKGTFEVSPQQTTTYTLTATDAKGNQVTRQATVKVKQPAPAPAVDPGAAPPVETPAPVAPAPGTSPH